MDDPIAWMTSRAMDTRIRSRFESVTAVGDNNKMTRQRAQVISDPGSQAALVDRLMSRRLNQPLN